MRTSLQSVERLAGAIECRIYKEERFGKNNAYYLYYLIDKGNNDLFVNRSLSAVRDYILDNYSK